MKQLLLGILIAMQAGCSRPRAVPEPRSVEARSSDPATKGSDTGWGSGIGWLVSQRFGLRIPLPKSPSWEITDRGFGWLVARQGATHSELRVSVWREDMLVRISDCERRLQGLQPFAELRAADILSRQFVEIGGFRSQLIVALQEDDSKQSRGFVVAYGAKLKSCWAAFFTTGAEERGSVESRVLQMDRLIRRVTEHTIEERAMRERLLE